MIKHQKEWPLMLEAARANRLTTPETILLFAIREVEDGKTGNEFNKINVQNTNLAVQTDSMAMQISKGEFLYQKYCKGELSSLKLEAKETPVGFLEFLGQHLMANEGFRKDSKWIKLVEEAMDEIDEFFNKGAINGNSSLN